jgi:hypothetical protein
MRWLKGGASVVSWEGLSLFWSKKNLCSTVNHLVSHNKVDLTLKIMRDSNTENFSPLLNGEVFWWSILFSRRSLFGGWDYLSSWQKNQTRNQSFGQLTADSSNDHLHYHTMIFFNWTIDLFFARHWPSSVATLLVAKSKTESIELLLGIKYSLQFSWVYIWHCLA